MCAAEELPPRSRAATPLHSPHRACRECAWGARGNCGWASRSGTWPQSPAKDFPRPAGQEGSGGSRQVRKKGQPKSSHNPANTLQPACRRLAWCLQGACTNSKPPNSLRFSKTHPTSAPQKNTIKLAASPGLEPGNTESKSGVLPLHYEAVGRAWRREMLATPQTLCNKETSGRFVFPGFWTAIILCCHVLWGNAMTGSRSPQILQLANSRLRFYSRSADSRRL